MTYKQVWNYMTNDVHDGLIVREEDGAFIPFDPDNIDYQEYMEWLKQGNNPNSYEAPQIEQQPVQEQKSTSKF
jgi:hypothetical protein